MAEGDGIKSPTWVRVVVVLVSDPADATKDALHFISFHFLEIVALVHTGEGKHTLVIRVVDLYSTL